MVSLKLVDGRAFACPPIFGNRIVTRGEVVEVDETQAEVLLEECYFDSANNQHFYFKEVDENDADQDDGKPKRRRRSAAAPEKE